MSGMGLAVAAGQLVGVQFRLHGRTPESGLDCIGVLAAALQRIGRAVAFPSGYLLRTEQFSSLDAIAVSHGFVRAAGAILPGDVIFVRPGPSQMHLLIAAAQIDCFVEAHAGLGRVVCRPGPIASPILDRWRLPVQPIAQDK